MGNFLRELSSVLVKNLHGVSIYNIAAFTEILDS